MEKLVHKKKSIGNQDFKVLGAGSNWGAKPMQTSTSFNNMFACRRRLLDWT